MNWMDVVFSDEKRFCLRSDGPRWVWRAAAVFTMDSKDSREYKELIARHIRKSLETPGQVLVFYQSLPANHGHGHDFEPR
jgi:hypothetical protein